MTRRAAILFAAMATVLVLASGVALAASIRCAGGECKGTPKADEMSGTARRDVMRAFGGNDKLYAKVGDDDLYGHFGADRLYGADG